MSNPAANHATVRQRAVPEEDGPRSAWPRSTGVCTGRGRRARKCRRRRSPSRRSTRCWRPLTSAHTKPEHQGLPGPGAHGGDQGPCARTSRGPRARLRTYEAAVGVVAKGDAKVINKAGLLSRDNKAPPLPLGKVTVVHQKPGKHPAEGILSWPAAPGATGYAIRGQPPRPATPRGPTSRSPLAPAGAGW